MRIHWTAGMTSTSPCEGLCRIVLWVARDGGPRHKHPPGLFTMQADCSVEVIDLFFVPRALWEKEATVEVDTENMAPGRKETEAAEAEGVVPGAPGDLSLQTTKTGGALWAPPVRLFFAG